MELSFLAAGTIVLYLIGKAIYNIFLHPLRNYPGPWYRSASRLPYTVSIFRGDSTRRVEELHKKYGHIVRITPDTLSYTCSQAWTDAYGFTQSAKRGGLAKDPKFYIKTPGVDTIVNDRNHRRLRRLQAPAFSDKALLLQERYLQHYVEKFVSCLHQQIKAENGAVDMVKWVNFLTTDIIGDLAFGESFGGLDSGELHPWLDVMFTTLKTFTFMREILRLPSWMIKAAMWCIPKELMEHQQSAVAFGAEAAKRRMAIETDRSDLMSYILKHDGKDEKGLSPAEIEMAAITFIIAGSETTATMISGTMYLLLCNLPILSELTSRIRSDFTSESDFTGVKLQQHEYLNAVLKEGLRLYPPAPDTLFRTTGNDSAVIAGRVVPPHTSLTVNLWAAHRSPANFHRPLEFCPERWLKEAPVEFGDDDKGVFKPFSIGPRDCLGKNLAWAEMRIILASLVWNFDFLNVEPDSMDWIDKQKIFSLWEKVPLVVKMVSVGGGDIK
ncbi:hypothetical protein JX265_007920 [Neoarthrinium moseri]|uniref:Uncharacterized protein n=1 Tax=Neoarthrinium moseri TaxID=1658444 RepID=A0A9P9WIT6_9PEZI|nr:hypothetical protein JX266_012474 [Neoarthrinium moseri]KAI1865597.1 hypothetical protein JX265_007920 [Neoarthrinium moseri]